MRGKVLLRRLGSVFVVLACVSTVLAGGIPNPSAPEGATAVSVGGTTYWLWQGVLYVML